MLTDKQQKFCDEYLVDLNATQAAIRAGYSEKTAHSIGNENLIKPEIQNYIKEKQIALSESTKITTEMVCKELAKIGFSNIQDYIKKGFTIENIQSLKREHAAAISSIETETIHFDGGSNTKVKFKLHDKLSALEKLAKHIGFFKEDNEQLKGTPVELDLSKYTDAELKTLISLQSKGRTSEA